MVMRTSSGNIIERDFRPCPEIRMPEGELVTCAWYDDPCSMGGYRWAEPGVTREEAVFSMVSAWYEDEIIQMEWRAAPEGVVYAARRKDDDSVVFRRPSGEAWTHATPRLILERIPETERGEYVAFPVPAP